MTRPVTLVALALAFLTAFAVGQLGMLMTNQPAATDSRAAGAPDAEATVRAFYLGIGSWVTSGDRALEQTVAPEFIDHGMAGEPAHDRAAFFSNLTSIHNTMPGLRLEITRIEAAGTIVSVDLTGSYGSIAPMLGWSLALPAQVEFREILRIDGHRIAERWHTNDLWPYGFWPVDLSLPVGAEAFRQPSIQEFELDPHTAAGLRATGTVVVLAESGALFVDQSGRDLAGLEQPVYAPIEEGAVRVFEAAGIVQVRNETGSAARFWTVSLDQVFPPRLPADTDPSVHPLGIQKIAGVSIAIQIPGNEVELSVRGITLPLGAELNTDGAVMHAIAVLGGELQVASDDGTVFYRLDSSRYRAVGGGETATAGQGFAVGSDGSATFRVTGDGPVRLLLLTVGPARPPAYQPIRTGPG